MIKWTSIIMPPEISCEMEKKRDHAHRDTPKFITLPDSAQNSWQQSNQWQVLFNIVIMSFQAVYFERFFH